MKLEKALLFLAVAVVSILLISAYGYKQTERRPLIKAEIINMSPENYIRKGDYMHNNEDVVHSVLYREYMAGRSHKWKDKYTYVYTFVGTTAFFDRVLYLGWHKEDGVDTKWIFSNQPPDPTIFRITYADE